MKITKPGIYDGLPMADYINDPCPEPSLSRGAVERLVMKTPAHAYHEHPRLGGYSGDHTAASDRGSAAHSILLGGDEQVVWVDANDWRTKKAKAERDEAHAAGRIPLLEKKRGPIVSMVESARAALDDLVVCNLARAEVLGEALSGGVGVTEQTVCWLEGDTWCRCRPDWMLTPGMDLVVDYKTTEIQGGPEAFIRGMVDRGNDIGARWQTRGIDAARGAARRDFVFLVQEVFEPYLCYSVSLGSHMEEMADAKIKAGLALWRRCRGEKVWPGYNPAVHYAETPTYAAFDWEARQAQLAGGA